MSKAVPAVKRTTEEENDTIYRSNTAITEADNAAMCPVKDEELRMIVEHAAHVLGRFVLRSTNPMACVGLFYERVHHALRDSEIDLATDVMNQLYEAAYGDEDDDLDEEEE